MRSQRATRLSRRLRPVVAAGLGLVLALVLAGCSEPTNSKPVGTAGTAPLTRFYTQKLIWTSCDKIFECASLLVPLDYTNPTRRSIALAVIRKQATDPAHRIGSLITNPGGPGASGVEFVQQGYSAQPDRPSHFGPQLRADFDIVGFDPRGVGASAPITCLTDIQLDHYVSQDPAPTTQPEVAAVVAEDKAFDAGCEAHSAMLLLYVGTANAARDLDILRAALGDQKMYYLGASYGTYLG
ncbi:MAG TPA: alpha/beta fold hydrolase, partial [Pseudonocardiaceae bacterium]|nr:alpha/beta fold hydrolase [Pseudonocardiaceae bacterium]